MSWLWHPCDNTWSLISLCVWGMIALSVIFFVFFFYQSVFSGPKRCSWISSWAGMLSMLLTLTLWVTGIYLGMSFFPLWKKIPKVCNWISFFKSCKSEKLNWRIVLMEKDPRFSWSQPAISPSTSSSFLSVFLSALSACLHAPCNML